MLNNAEIVTEISFQFPNISGVLAKAARALANAGIGIRGMLNYSKGSTTETFMVLSKDIPKAKKILQKHGVLGIIGEGNIVAVKMEGEVGAIAEMSEKLAKANINISNMYVCEAFQGPSVIYISTNDDDKTVEVLNKN